MKTTDQRAAELAALADPWPREEVWAPKPGIVRGKCGGKGCRRQRPLRFLSGADVWLCCPCWDAATLGPEVSR